MASQAVFGTEMSAENIVGASQARAHIFQASSQLPVGKTPGSHEVSSVSQINGNASLEEENSSNSPHDQRKKQKSAKRQKNFHSESNLIKYKILIKPNSSSIQNGKPSNLLYCNTANYTNNNAEVLISKENIPEQSCSLNEYILASNTDKIHKHIIHTSQYLTDNNSVNENMGIINNLDKNIQPSECQIYATIEGNNNKEDVSDSNQNQILVSEHLSSNETFENDDVVQEVDINNLISNSKFSLITPTSRENFKFELNKHSDNMNDHFVPEILIPENANRVYGKLENKLSVHPLEQSHQISSPSISASSIIDLILSLKQDINKLTEKVEKQELILNTVVNASTINLTPLFVQTFCEKYNINLPISTIDEFDKFNLDLSKNTCYCNEFITSLCSYIDNNVSLAKNILTMIRTHLSRDLVILYTATKATANKMVLKDTIFCKCLLQATRLTIRNGLLPLEHEKAFMKNLSLVVSGARSWTNNYDGKKNI